MNKKAYSRIMKNVKKTNKALERLISEGGSPEQVDTCLFLQKAVYILAKTIMEKACGNLTYDVQQDLGLHPKEYLECRQAYETYLGMTDSLPSRFSIQYLAEIPIGILLGCLPALRRADYLKQQGKFTSVAMAPDLITVPVILPSTSEVFVSDLRTWFALTNRMRMIAPRGGGIGREVNLGEIESLEFFDNFVTDEPLPPFLHDQISPTYSSSKHQYYNELSKNPKILKGYNIIQVP